MREHLAVEVSRWRTSSWIRGALEEAGVWDEAVAMVKREEQTKKFAFRVKERILPSRVG